MQWVVLIAVAVATLDQITKWLVVRFIGSEESRIVVRGCFDLVNWSNTGAAWGILKGYNFVLVTASVLALVALCVFRHTFQLHRSGSRVAFGLIAGGIVGNLIDRVRFGHVVDFLYFYIGQYHWPAFNVADSGICVGLGLFIILSWRGDRDASKANTAAQT